MSAATDGRSPVAPMRPPSGPPVFVVGCGRSGTTMLRMMLDSHPDLAIPGESHFLPSLARRRPGYLTGETVDAAALADEIVGIPHWKRWGTGEDLVHRRVAALKEPSFADVIEAVYMAYADARSKQRWGDKTPIYVRSIELLAELFPTARFVHVVRDGRDVALSYLSVPWGPRSLRQAAYKWRRDAGDGKKAERLLGPRYAEVRYDDLVGDTQSVLRRLCGFLELPYDLRMLEYHKTAHERIQSEPENTSFHGSVTKPPTSGLRNWRDAMPPRDIKTFEAIAGDLLEEFGFERLFPAPPSSRRAAASVAFAVMRARERAGGARKAIRRLGKSVATGAKKIRQMPTDGSRAPS
jgi:hypothetical protein